MTSPRALPSQVEVLIVGAGQAGLAIAQILGRAGLSYRIVDRGARVGGSWRERWDSLRLFTPGPVSGLPGMAFPPTAGFVPTKDEMADYLEAYARRFAIPVELGSPVGALRREARGLVAASSAGEIVARRVVVATGTFQRPHLPALARDLGPAVFQLHSAAYRRPSQLPPGPVLVVGAANSGAQIAADLAGDRAVHLSIGKRLPTPPQKMRESLIAWRFAAFRSVHLRFLEPSGLPWPIGLAKFVIPAPERLAREHGVTLLPRAVAARGTEILLEDGRSLAVASVVWATGYRPDHGWIALDAFDAAGAPRCERPLPGLYFLGQLGSARLLPGVAAAARRLARRMLRDRADAPG